MAAPAFDRRAVAAWCLYDWANSAFPTIVTTFLFSAYVATAVAGDTLSGTAQWGRAMSLAGLAIAISSPVLGAIADRGGPRKPWLAAMTLICVVATAALWYVRPDPGDLRYALVVAAVATVGFELGTVFYNAMLPGLVPREWLGRVSGWGWALGYSGGLVCLSLALVLFVRPVAPLFDLDEAAAEPVRIAMPLAALWFALFAWPLFLLVPDRAPSGGGVGAAVRGGLVDLLRTLKEVRRHANVARFLLAKMVYIEGLNTLFAFGGIYAVGTFGMALDEALLFGILLNVSSGLGAFAFAWVDDLIGPKRTILISLGAIIALGVAGVTVEDKRTFYAIAMGFGAFLGPAQAASRSFMARLAPPAQATEFFGLYGLAGKASAFLGPALVAWATLAFASQRAGIAVTLVFMAAGFLLLLPVRERSYPSSSP